jgi:hypothetical protein
MSEDAAVYREAYEAGRAAFKAGLPSSANPHQIDPGADLSPRERALAALWRSGWAKNRPELLTNEVL